MKIAVDASLHRNLFLFKTRLWDIRIFVYASILYTRKICMAELINDRYCNAANRFIRLPKSDKSQEKVQMIILNPAKVDGFRISNFVNLVAFQFSKFPWQALRDIFWKWTEACYDAWKVNGMSNHGL